MPGPTKYHQQKRSDEEIREPVGKSKQWESIGNIHQIMVCGCSWLWMQRGLKPGEKLRYIKSTLRDVTHKS